MHGTGRWNDARPTVDRPPDLTSYIQMDRSLDNTNDRVTQWRYRVGPANVKAIRIRFLLLSTKDYGAFFSNISVGEFMSERKLCLSVLKKFRSECYVLHRFKGLRGFRGTMRSICLCDWYPDKCDLRYLKSLAHSEQRNYI